MRATKRRSVVIPPPASLVVEVPPPAAVPGHGACQSASTRDGVPSHRMTLRTRSDSVSRQWQRRRCSGGASHSLHLPASPFQIVATSMREVFTRKLCDMTANLQFPFASDQGKQMTENQTLAVDLVLRVYICHAHSPPSAPFRKPARLRPQFPAQGLPLPMFPVSNSASTRKCSPNARKCSSDESRPLNASMDRF
jgi:hypothetical protein